VTKLRPGKSQSQSRHEGRDSIPPKRQGVKIQNPYPVKSNRETWKLIQIMYCIKTGLDVEVIRKNEHREKERKMK
jgi:hypothetical protein